MLSFKILFTYSTWRKSAFGVGCCGNVGGCGEAARVGITRVVRKYQFDAAAVETTD